MEPIKIKPSKSVNQICATASTGQLSYDNSDSEDIPICWICLDGGSSCKPLTQPCKCPRYCHAACLARWQLQSAGSRKETHCDFCGQQLPDWKSALTPACGAKAPAVMNVNFDGRMYSFEVQSGPDGYREFTHAIRKAFSLPDDSELNITFTCDEPSSGSLLTLQGAGAYDAAVHCAAVSAARRMCTQHNTGSLTQRVLNSAPLLGTPARRAMSFGAGESSHSSRSVGTSTSSSSGNGNGSVSRSASSLASAGRSNSMGGRVAPSSDGADGVAGAAKLRRLSTFGRRVRSALLDLISLR